MKLPHKHRSPSAADAHAAVVKPEPTMAAAPGTAALLDGLGKDRDHAVLDLGPAADQSLHAYGRFARWISFADLLGEAWWPDSELSAPGLQLPDLDRRYDLVFGWDILDRLLPDDRLRLIHWLAEITAPKARVHMIVRGADDAISSPLRFTLVDIGHVRYDVAGSGRLPLSRLLPAEVAKVLAPLQVLRAFTLKNGLREYVALRP